jgi:hypothetical protein
LIELPTILFAVWSETIGCIYFICPGCAEYVLANEVVLKTLREQQNSVRGVPRFEVVQKESSWQNPLSFFLHRICLHLTHFPKIMQYKINAWIF